jgi:hypothetical protein
MYEILFFVIGIVWTIALALVSYFVFAFIVRFKTFLRKHKYKADKFSTRYGIRYVKVVFRNTFQFKEKVDKGEIKLDKISNPFLVLFLNVIDFFKFMYSFPIFVIRITIGLINPEAFYWLPINLYNAWYILLIATSFSLATHSYTTLAMCIAVISAFFSLSDVIDYFRRDTKGVIKIFSLPKHKMRISEIVWDWLLIVGSYGAIYYSLYIKDPISFSHTITIPDSIYFSFVTITTLGYGDIVPKSYFAKSIVITEVIFGFIFIIIVFSIFVSVWIEKWNIKIN